MTTLAAWCAALPAAHIALPVRYTLWVLAVFAVLAALFWRTRQLRRFVPVGFVCAVAAVMLGGTMQRDVVRLAMVGTAGNGCVVAVQNNRAVVLYRGSAANGRAVQQYLTQNGAPELAAVIDLRTEPGEMPLQAAQLLTIADLIETAGLRPALVIGVPVGFVNVVESKERLFSVCTAHGVPAIVAMGRKGGSNVAAAICNALVYSAAGMLDPTDRGWK